MAWATERLNTPDKSWEILYVGSEDFARWVYKTAYKYMTPGQRIHVLDEDGIVVEDRTKPDKDTVRPRRRTKRRKAHARNFK